MGFFGPQGTDRLPVFLDVMEGKGSGISSPSPRLTLKKVLLSRQLVSTC